MTSWPELTQLERQTIIASLYAEGQSAGYIASQIPGATRNAVIGYIVRMDLPKRRSTVALENPVMPHTRQPRQMASLTKMAPVPKPSKPTPELYSHVWQPLPGHAPISLLDMPRSGQCRWPVNGGFCAAECGDVVYCPTHAKVAFKPTPPIGVRK